MLITDKYPSVVATRYRLQTRKMAVVDGEDKQIWDINCKSRINEGKKLNSSAYIEEMNSVDSNIYFEIDEQATEEAQEYLANKMLAKQEKEKDSHLTTNEAIGKLAAAISKGDTAKKPKKAKEEVEVDPELEELRVELKEASGKKVFHGWDKDQLREKIEELKQ